jgi:hypothetical protein
MTIDKVHLVLAYDGEVYVDSAWTTSDGAAQRIAFLKDTRAAFKAYESRGLKSLAVRLDASGVAIHLELPPVPVPLALKNDQDSHTIESVPDPSGMTVCTADAMGAPETNVKRRETEAKRG